MMPERRTALTATSWVALVLMAACGHGETKHEAHWSYEGHGAPEHWASLNAENQACGAGHKQSPVDLVVASAQATAHPKIAFQYRPSAMHMLNNGHTVQMNYDAGSTAMIDGQPYQLVQFHFHSPSEHTVNGKAYPLEVHLVHRSASGSLAVIGILFEKGAANPALATLWPSFPTAAGNPVDAAGTFNAASLVPGDTKFLTYPGSLTTPPCTEGVLWNVAQKASTASDEQISFFVNKFYNGNARPVQPMHDRTLHIY